MALFSCKRGDQDKSFQNSFLSRDDSSLEQFITQSTGGKFHEPIQNRLDQFWFENMC